MRIFTALAVCVALLVVLTTGLVYFLLQGRTGQGSAIVSGIEERIEAITGDQFDVRIDEVDLDFSNIGQVTLVSENIAIVRKKDEVQLSKIGKFAVSAGLLELITGSYSFEYARIDEAWIEAGVLGSGQALLLPANLHEPLDVTGETLARVYRNFTSEAFESFEIYNSTISGPVFGRVRDDPITIDRLAFTPIDDKSFGIAGLLRTELSDVEVTSRYTVTGETPSASYSFKASGIDVREWLEDPSSELGVVASDSKVTVTGKLPFDEENRAQDPSVKIQTSESTLRVGLDSITDIKSADFNFRLLLDKNQIELDPSEISIGRLRASLIGGIKPANEEAGYFGPLLYDIIMSRGEFEPTLEGEQVVPAAFKMTGLYDRDAQEFGISEIFLTTKDGAIVGSGKVGLAGETPSVVATASTKGISVEALKQFWPFFVASGAREWIQEHVVDGWISSGTMNANVPAGKIFRLKDGVKLTPDEYKTILEIDDLKFRPFGEMPPISEATGTVALEGMKISANMTGGMVRGFGENPVKIDSGSFVMDDFAAAERWGETNIELDGDIRSIAEISDRKPLRVMERLKVESGQFKGQGHANIASRFPVGRKADYDEVEWNVLLELKDGSSSKKLSGRKLADADLLIDANSTGAKVTGTMNIDGVNTRVNFIEPIGKSGKVKRKRQISTVLDEKARLAMGIDLKPVIDGPVSVEAVEAGKSEKYRLDFTKATVSLPWLGWSKGVDIPASGEFVLKRLENGVRLEGFKLSGQGFEGQGTLVIDKTGLVSADFSKLKLNETDDFQIKVKRTKSAYNINASGLSYDARGVINTLIHRGGFKKAQGGRSVNLVANFATVRGFGKREVHNAILLYESRNGRLHKLDMHGQGKQGEVYNVQAQLNGDQTLFTVKTNDAGTSLAFTNLYSRMEGGELVANLIQAENGPYLGPVRITDFSVVNEPRLKSMASSVKSHFDGDRGQRRRIIPDGEDRKIRFLLADAQIERGSGYFKVSDTIIRSTTMGIAMDGTVYDPQDRMSITGTFMPANGVNLAVSSIPLLGQLFSNGKDNGLIGVTYKLAGPRTNPELVINPLSIVTPGIFNKVFEFKQ